MCPRTIRADENCVRRVMGDIAGARCEKEKKNHDDVLEYVGEVRAWQLLYPQRDDAYLLGWPARC